MSLSTLEKTFGAKADKPSTTRDPAMFSYTPKSSSILMQDGGLAPEHVSVSCVLFLLLFSSSGLHTASSIDFCKYSFILSLKTDCPDLRASQHTDLGVIRTENKSDFYSVIWNCAHNLRTAIYITPCSCGTNKTSCSDSSSVQREVQSVTEPSSLQLFQVKACRR